MAKTANEYEIIVCQDNATNKQVVAVVVVNIRTVYWDHGTKLKVGWVYGLRVHEYYQNQGIGQAISAELEQRCLQRGVSLLHLTVNLDNSRARSLYKKLGYQDASDRAPVTKFLTNKSAMPKPFICIQIPPNAAANFMAEHYDQMDMSPTDGFLNLVQSKEYETTLVVVDESELSPGILELRNKKDQLSTAILKAIQNGKVKSYGGIVLWNGSANKMFKVVRLVLSKETWLSRPFQLIMLCAMLSIFVLWWWRAVLQSLGVAFRINGVDDSTWNDSTTWQKFRSLALLVLELLTLLASSMAAYKFVHFFRFIVSRDPAKLNARAFAPFRKGPMGLDCLKNALLASQNYARSEGYGIWILNVSEKHPDSKAFSKRGFRTKFLQKWLKGENMDKKWEKFDLSSFSDPRDL
eukprot:CAMPEP_0113446722 /NCGR_PEP_ID=MMETSP0014_2-20120614/3860_1 /TAXON_ID=2857 /ORGANISM="Nitzschia sp." /LENGTH=407 /DNA_ID=CAMNT_0000337837 /DNA_START=133 /DNA_END=1356 /DNA_ORIENTATION=+ /assembly_acc=CAM_ASM_000159